MARQDNAAAAPPLYDEGAGTRHGNLWKRQLGAVPDAVWDERDAESLVLAESGLTAISERIGELRQLRMLDLGHNALTSLPRRSRPARALLA